MSTRTPPSDNGRENDPRKELRFLCKDQIKIPMLFKKSRSPSAWLSVVVMLSVIYGFGILNLFFLKEDPLNISVVVLASSYSTEESRDPAIFEEIIDVITNSVNNMHPDIIVLPENIFPFLTIDIKSGLPIEYSFGEEMPDVFRSIKELSGSNPGTTFLIGSHSVLFESNSQENKNDFSLQHPIGEHSDYDYFNSLIAVEEGEIRSFYHKRLLLLFSEWAPGFLGEHHMSPMSKGNKYGIETQHGNFGVFICSEISSSLYSRTPKRSVLLIVPSNDSVLPHPQTARYHHAKARIQAVTHSAPLLRSAKGGISSILDSRGRVIEKIDLSDRPFEKQKPSDPQNKEVGKSVIEILYAQL